MRRKEVSTGSSSDQVSFLPRRYRSGY